VARQLPSWYAPEQPERQKSPPADSGYGAPYPSAPSSKPPAFGQERELEEQPERTVRSKRRQRRHRHEHVNHERWLVSYADFVTLLFAVFVAMYAMSNIDAKKLETMVSSLQEAFSPSEAAALEKLAKDGHILSATKPPPKLSKGAGPGGEVGLGEVRERIRAGLAQDILQKRVEIEMDRRGLVISIREAGSFALGSSDLSPDAQAILQQIGITLGEVNNRIRVEGHTDDVPIHTARYASNWELSTARATNVVAFFLAHSEVRPERLSAAGYAEFYPRVPNSSEGGRARNRRVDLVILNPSTETAEEPTKAADKE
jgi:chemotaxis protein MotB